MNLEDGRPQDGDLSLFTTGTAGKGGVAHAAYPGRCLPSCDQRSGPGRLCYDQPVCGLLGTARKPVVESGRILPVAFGLPVRMYHGLAPLSPLDVKKDQVVQGGAVVLGRDPGIEYAGHCLGRFFCRHVRSRLCWWRRTDWECAGSGSAGCVFHQDSCSVLVLVGFCSDSTIRCDFRRSFHQVGREWRLGSGYRRFNPDFGIDSWDLHGLYHLATLLRLASTSF